MARHQPNVPSNQDARRRTGPAAQRSNDRLACPHPASSTHTARGYPSLSLNLSIPRHLHGAPAAAGGPFSREPSTGSMPTPRKTADSRTPHPRKHLNRARRMGRAAYRNGDWRGNLVAHLCHPATAQAYESGYDDARLRAALRYSTSGRVLMFISSGSMVVSWTCRGIEARRAPPRRPHGPHLRCRPQLHAAALAAVQVLRPALLPRRLLPRLPLRRAEPRMPKDGGGGLRHPAGARARRHAEGRDPPESGDRAWTVAPGQQFPAPRLTGCLRS